MSALGELAAVASIAGTLMIGPVALMYGPAFPIGGTDQTSHPGDCRTDDERAHDDGNQPLSHPQHPCRTDGNRVLPVSMTIQEDSPGWDCRIDGNRICGPANADQVPAGCYDDTAALVAVWPCHVEVDRFTGESDVFTP